MAIHRAAVGVVVATFYLGASVGVAAPPRMPTAAARRAYAQHLKAGRALAGASKWREAMAELEAALTALPHDPAALSELSYVASEAHDWARARQAGTECTTASLAPKLRATCYYNLGRVAEETHDKATAIAMYQHALILRESDVAEQRMLALDPSAKVPKNPGLPCWRPHPLDQLLACISGDFAATIATRPALRAGAQRAPGDPLPCRFQKEALPDARLVECKENRDTTIYLVTADADGWATRMDLGGEAERARVMRSFTAGLSWRMVGKRRVLSIETLVSVDIDDLMEPDGYAKESLSGEAFYVPGSSLAPLRVTDSYEFKRYAIGDSGSDGKLIGTSSYAAKLEIGDDGTASVVEKSRIGKVPDRHGVIDEIESPPGRYRLW
jgi:hypothetical protein